MFVYLSKKKAFINNLNYFKKIYNKIIYRLELSKFKRTFMKRRYVSYYFIVDFMRLVRFIYNTTEISIPNRLTCKVFIDKEYNISENDIIVFTYSDNIIKIVLDSFAFQSLNITWTSIDKRVSFKIPTLICRTEYEDVSHIIKKYMLEIFDYINEREMI